MTVYYRLSTQIPMTLEALQTPEVRACLERLKRDFGDPCVSVQGEVVSVDVADTIASMAVAALDRSVALLGRHARGGAIVVHWTYEDERGASFVGPTPQAIRKAHRSYWLGQLRGILEKELALAAAAAFIFATVRGIGWAQGLACKAERQPPRIELGGTPAGHYALNSRSSRRCLRGFGCCRPPRPKPYRRWITSGTAHRSMRRPSMAFASGCARTASSLPRQRAPRGSGSTGSHPYIGRSA